MELPTLDTWAYDLLFLLSVLFKFDALKYSKISLTFLENITKTDGESLLILASLFMLLLSFFLVLMGFTFGVNLVETFCLKELLLLLV